jgi:hypothetical protein
MALIQFPPTTSATGKPPHWRYHRVEFRRKWTDKWEALPYLDCTEVTLGAQPTMPRAIFRWQSGKILRESRDTTTFQTVEPQKLEGAFVRVLLLREDAAEPGEAGNADTRDAITLWAGIVAETHTDVLGAAKDAPAPVGDQQIVAYGLEYIFERARITGSWFSLGTLPDDDHETLSQTNHVLPFNEKFIAGFNALGNRSADQHPIPGDEEKPADEQHKAYIFGNSPPFLWSGHDIVEYLVAFFGPRDIPIKIGGQVNALQAWQPPRMRVASGTSLRDAINTVIDRRRGLGWFLKPVDERDDGGKVKDGGTNSFELTVFSVFDEPVPLGDATLDANPAVKLDLTDNKTLKSLRISSGTLGRPGKIIVEGERVVSCFTVAVQEQTLEPAWAADDETAYKNGANLDEGTPDADHPNRSPQARALNDLARKSARFEDVYRAFRIPNSWQWKAGSGTGTGGDRKIASPLVDLTSGNLQPTREFQAREWGHRMLRVLPVRKKPASNDAVPEFEAPFVIVGFGGRYIFLHNHDEAAVRCHLRMLDSDFGFIVQASPNHELAAANWGGAKPSKTQPIFDYHKLLATVAARTDASLRIEIDVPKGDKTQQVYIHVADAELWYILPNTIKDIDSKGQLVRFTDDEKIARDDSPRLRQIGVMAAAWYGQNRAGVQIVDERIVLGYPVGTYIKTTVHQDTTLDVNSVITQVTIDLASETTTIATDFVQLDFVGPAGPQPRLF